MLAWALAASGCLVPSLEELEADAPLACDEAEACVAGYTCVEGKCLPGKRECAEGETRTCGVQRGECIFGLETCDALGAFGPCDTSRVTVTTFYEAETESSCDGKDNDCDGEVDEGLARACPLTEGVCSGTVSLCSGGEWSACTEATYRAKSSAYQARETLCDGLDNDCDGAEDGTSTEVVPASPGQPRLGAALPLGQGTSADVLLAWEERQRVWVRRVNADGGLGAPRFPALSVASSPKSYGPAFASCDSPGGDCDVAAWFEQYPCPSGGQCARLVAGLVQPEGWTHVGANGNADAGVVTVVYGDDTRDLGGELALAREGTRLVGSFTLSTPGAGSTVHLVSCNANLRSLCKHASLGAGEMPSVALSADGMQGAVAWHRDAGLVVADFDFGTMDWTQPPETRAAWDVAGSAGESAPQLLGDPASALRLYSLGELPDGGAPAVTFRTAIPPMGSTAGKALATLSTAELLEFRSQPGPVSSLRAQAEGQADRLAFQAGSGVDARAWLATHADGGWVNGAVSVGTGTARPVLGPPGTLFTEGAGALQQQLACFP